MYTPGDEHVPASPQDVPLAVDMLLMMIMYGHGQGLSSASPAAWSPPRAAWTNTWVQTPGCSHPGPGTKQGDEIINKFDFILISSSNKEKNILLAQTHL